MIIFIFASKFQAESQIVKSIYNKSTTATPCSYNSCFVERFLESSLKRTFQTERET